MLWLRTLAFAAAPSSEKAAATNPTGPRQFCGATVFVVEAKRVLDRIVAMLTKLGQRGHSVNEDPPGYGTKADDANSDTDLCAGASAKEHSDPEKSQRSAALDGNRGRRADPV